MALPHTSVLRINPRETEIRDLRHDLQYLPPTNHPPQKATRSKADGEESMEIHPGIAGLGVIRPNHQGNQKGHPRQKPSKDRHDATTGKPYGAPLEIPHLRLPRVQRCRNWHSLVDRRQETITKKSFLVKKLHDLYTSYNKNRSFWERVLW